MLDSVESELHQAVLRQEEACGRFVLVERIGSGGMATVHRAIQRDAGGVERELVVKRILPQLASEKQFVTMFIEEAKLGAHLNHPNIVQVFDLGQLDNGYFIAMEYVEGISLLRMLRSQSPDDLIAPTLAAHIVFQICQGLDYAHSLTLDDGRPLCLVHRDVSPANVMLSTYGYVKLLDFGIAKAVGAIEREETRTGTLKGKLAYMSPEQVEGEALTPRSDIFVTGTLFWEALTGRRLFKAATDYQTLTNVVKAKAPPPSSLRPGLSEELDRICLRALHRDPAERYQSAEEMADDIERSVLADHPVGPSQLAVVVKKVMATNRDEADASAESAADGEPDWRAELAEDGDARVPGAYSSSSSIDARAVHLPVDERRSGRRRWMLTTLAFVGGAIVASAALLAIGMLTGLLKFG
jgi:serine/threonine protein kinase